MGIKYKCEVSKENCYDFGFGLRTNKGKVMQPGLKARQLSRKLSFC